MIVSDEVFEQLVAEALKQIPAAFAPHLANVAIEIEDLPDRRTCSALGIDNPHNLLGLYHGVQLLQRSVEHVARLPDRISIYRTNIQRICKTRAELVTQIRKTVLHEVGHLFGLDEDDLEKLGYA